MEQTSAMKCESKYIFFKKDVILEMVFMLFWAHC